MSDHPKEAQRNLKRIVICADVCLAVFRLLPPAKVGLELALVSCRFDVLADADFRTRRWALGTVKIDKSPSGVTEIGKWNADERSETLPIPQTPLPNGIVAFGRINFLCVTKDAIAFLQRLERLLQSDITLDFGTSAFDDGRGNRRLFRNFGWPLLNPSVGIVKMHFQNVQVLQNFRALISPSVLRDCANLRLVTLAYGHPLEFPPDDCAGASYGQALCKWLHTPRADGQPKVLKIRFPLDYIEMEALKRKFLSASVGANFIILISTIYGGSLLPPFEVENALTREQLTMRKIGYDWWMVVRSPIVRSADQWAEWEREAMAKRTHEWKVIGFGR